MNISIYAIVVILVCHWFFDWFLQTDEMSKGKSKSNFTLFYHVWVYLIGLAIMTTLILVGSDRGWGAVINNKVEFALTFTLINAFAHFVTDWVTSRATSGLYKEERYHDFFVTIGADQMVHYITLFGTYALLAK